PASSEQNIFSDPSDIEVSSASDIWDMLKEGLCKNELKALDVIIVNGDLKKFADESGIMLEVLVDGINEKAMDYIGDNILDEDMAIYEDYEEYIKGMVKTV
ncbi:MAG TPA: tellurite resistance TerB C-terminal domain-containing protein, partial [Clostridia bacterium]|nr:tellurite resistance TerB C-terminal domain-containing protein [Clostridia bacterium]